MVFLEYMMGIILVIICEFDAAGVDEITPWSFMLVRGPYLTFDYEVQVVCMIAELRVSVCGVRVFLLLEKGGIGEGIPVGRVCILVEYREVHGFPKLLQVAPLVGAEGHDACDSRCHHDKDEYEQLFHA